MEKEIYVNKLHNPLKKDFAFGIDLSEVLELEELGAKWYDENGKEKDIFALFSEAGFNCVRLRLWNDPYAYINGKKYPYGGGTNSLKRDIILARRAKKHGMSICLDYHLSDSYTDPETHHLPKAWMGEKPEMMASKTHHFIKDTLLAFQKEGVLVSSVQVGNECINAIAGANIYKENERAKEIFLAGIKAVKEVYPNAKTILHFTDIHHAIQKYLLPKDGCDLGSLPFDVIGFSYYPFWHGTLKDYEDALRYVKENYPDKETMVMETSYGFTDDKNEHIINQYHSWDFGTIGRYDTSPQGQATCLYDELEVLAKYTGSGIFYWAGAWIPVKGTQYISKYGRFYLDHARDPIGEEEIENYNPYVLASWSNQALFDYNGKALPSLYTFKHILNDDREKKEEIVGLRYSSMTLPLEEAKLPQYTDCVSNLGRLTVEQIDWEPYSFNNVGKYLVNGRIISTGKNVQIEVTINRKNHILNGNFEDKSTYPFAAWAYSETAPSSYFFGDPSLPVAPYSGERFLGYVAKEDFSFSLSQIAYLDGDGEYIFSAQVRGKGTTLLLTIGTFTKEFTDLTDEYREISAKVPHLSKGNTLVSLSVRGNKGALVSIDEVKLERV